MSRYKFSPTNSKYIKNIIPAIYQNGFTELTIWAWIQALRTKGMTVIEAAHQYREHFGLTEDEAPLSNMLMIYHRKHKEFINVCKTEGRMIRFASDNVRETAIEATLEATTEVLTRFSAKFETDSAKDKIVIATLEAMMERICPK